MAVCSGSMALMEFVSGVIFVLPAVGLPLVAGSVELLLLLLLVLPGRSASVGDAPAVGSTVVPVVEVPDFACVDGDGKDLEPGKLTALGRRVIGFVGVGVGVGVGSFDFSVTTSELEAPSVV